MKFFFDHGTRQRLCHSSILTYLRQRKKNKGVYSRYDSITLGYSLPSHEIVQQHHHQEGE